jgi:hypothetical protein
MMTGLQTIQTALGYLAGLVLSTTVLISQPRLALLIGVFAAVVMSMCMSAAFAVYYFRRNEPCPTAPCPVQGIVGTHLGSGLCYGIVFLQATQSLM